MECDKDVFEHALNIDGASKLAIDLGMRPDSPGAETPTPTPVERDILATAFSDEEDTLLEEYSLSTLKSTSDKGERSDSMSGLSDDIFVTPSVSPDHIKQGDLSDDHVTSGQGDPLGSV